ncbi:zinc finger protein 184-like [Penaeus japonicus]|uniref:zinc finger protein 184-like n=1 Tax=Penaeus japonicus TaxID=27405 RepID=UPI001C7132AE|nr:zinc finger protein 184-like [Penaeus japonicus]
MGSYKHLIHETFSVITEFIQEVEGQSLVECNSISYHIKDNNQLCNVTTFSFIVEHLISKLKEIVDSLRHETQHGSPSAQQTLPGSEVTTDNESSEESVENPGSGEESLACRKGPSSPTFGIPTENKSADCKSTLPTLAPLPEVVAMGSPNGIASTMPPASLITGMIGPSSTYVNTFTSAAITGGGMPEVAAMQAVSLDMEPSLCPREYGDPVHLAKCRKCGAEFTIDSDAYTNLPNGAVPNSCSQCCSIADSVSRRRRKAADNEGVPVSSTVASAESRASEAVPKKHNCDKCGRVFSKWKHLSIHYTKVHLDEDGVEAPGVDTGNPEVLSNNTLPLYCCKTCNLACLSIQRFNTHNCRLPTDDDNTISALSNRILITNVLKLHKLRKFVCETCGVEYRTFKRITYHLPRCSPGPYPCNVCSTLFSTQKDLNYHKKKTHKDEKCFVCEECGKSFQRRTSLQKHSINWHESSSAVGPFKCELCPKKFIRRIYLTNHKLRMHGLDKKFLCQVCGNKFMTQNSLMAHMEVHSDLKRFECTFCKKKFKRKEKLKYHERIHTGERPFQCQMCTRGFVSKTKLDEHMSRHRGDRRYRCSYCTKSYAGAWDLKQHVRKVHDKQCDKVAVTMVAPNQNTSGNAAVAQVQVLDPLAIATAASGLKEEEGVTCGNSLALSHTQPTSSSSAAMEEVGNGMIGGPQYITVGGQQAVTIPVVGGMQGHMPPIGHVVQVSGSTVPLTSVGTALAAGGTSVQAVQTVQAVQAVQAIPGVTTAEYSVQTLPPQAVHTAQGYIFTQGFDMVSSGIQY